MAGTTYNTLNLGEEVAAPKESRKLRKVVVVASVFVAASVMFFAGRVFQDNATPFTHEEVMNIAETCGEGQFIGQCEACSSCAAYEYVNGGCTAFKDTFCSFCEPIDNCNRENTVCTNAEDQRCLTCNCNEKVSAWGSITRAEARLTGNPDDAAVYDCSFSRTDDNGEVNSQVCTPCSVCPKGSYEVKACDPAAHTDTECRRCTSCNGDEFVKSPCTYQDDTVCEPCTVCDASYGSGKTLDVLCTGIAYNEDTNERMNVNDIFVTGADTVCKDCSSCSDDADNRQYVAKECTSGEDTKCEACTKCADGQYISSVCEMTEGEFTVTTMNAECADCTPLPLGSRDTPEFLTQLCNKDTQDNFVGEACTVCEVNQFVNEECQLGTADLLGVNTDCQDCGQLVGCSVADIRCTKDSASTCSGCTEQFAEWGNCCENGALGASCGWQKEEAGCSAGGRSYRERSAVRGGFDFENEGNAAFVRWCKQTCEAFSDCTGFEVEDCLFSDTKCVTADTVCAMKDTAIVGDGAEGLSCFRKPE